MRIELIDFVKAHNDRELYDWVHMALRKYDNARLKGNREGQAFVLLQIISHVATVTERTESYIMSVMGVN